MNGINNLTMREVVEIEALTGLSITTLADSDTPQGKSLAAIAYVIRKREDKDFTFDQALDMNMTDIQELLGLGEQDPLEVG